MEIEYLQRLDELHTVAAVQLFPCHLTDQRVHVDGVNDLDVGKLLHNAADTTEDAVHGLAQIFTAVGGQQDHTFPICQPFQLGVGIIFAYRRF